MSLISYVSPAYLGTLIIEPLRWFFASEAVQDDLRWSSDPQVSYIEIDSINNFNKIAIQAKPRILVSRGGYSVNGMSISDRLATGKPTTATKGLKDATYMSMASGTGQILIEGRSEGTVEKILDLTSHFLSWSGPLICDTHNFKQFANNLSISPCTPSREDTEIFSATINLPWVKEERWSVKTDGVILKQFLLTLI